MKAKTLNIKTATSVTFLIVLLVVMQVYGQDVKTLTKTILESDLINLLILAYIIGTLTIHGYLYSSRELQKDSFIYKHFGKYADAVFEVATYGLAGTTSLALLKGLYLQTFYEAQYFNGFGGFDLASMCILTSFLLFYCLFNTTIRFKAIVFFTETSKIETS